MPIWRAIVMLLTLKCDDATHLVSDSFDRDLTAVERWALKLHHLSCKYCRRLAKQLDLIHQAARKATGTSPELPADARDRIAAALASSKEPEN